MRLLAVALIMILIGPILHLVETAEADQTGSNGKVPVPGVFLVKFKPGVSEQDKSAILKQSDAAVIDEIGQINVKVIRVPEKASDRILQSLSYNKAVDYVESEVKISPSSEPNDPDFSKQWHLAKIEAARAWDLSMGSGQIIAVLDTGIDSSHPDLAAKIVDGYNFYDNTGNFADVCGHGTSTAGVAAAITNNGAGVAGVAADSKIMPIKITDPSCNGYYSAMVKGLVYAADNGVRVANISFRIFDGFALKDAAKYMFDKGGWTVASAGNTGIFENYSDNPYIISVGATDSRDLKASYSSYGSYVDFAAPGSSIYTTIKGGYGSKSGTSFSAPVVAGILALLYSKDPNLSPSQVLDVLKQSSVDLGDKGYDYYYGYGRVDAYGALQLLSTSDDTIVPPPDPKEQEPLPLAVSIAEPLAGSTVKGQIAISVSVSGGSGTEKVEIYIGDKLVSQLFSSPYNYTWNTRSYNDGTHLITVRALDTSGTIATQSIDVPVLNKKSR